MRARRGLPGRRVLTGAAVAALVLGGGVTAWAATGSDPAGYRSAAVTTDDVTETLSGTGTVTPRKQEDLTFGTSGTVAGVSVAVGDRVTAGQRVARLSKAELRAALLEAQASLAQAKATLSRDRSSQTTSATSATSSPSSTTAASSTTSAASTSNETVVSAETVADEPDPALAALTKLQDALLAAQQQADQALATSTAAVEQQKTACTPAADGTTDTDACTAALAAAQAAQTITGDAQQKVEDAIDALTKALTEAVKATSSGGSGSKPSGTPTTQPSTQPSAQPSAQPSQPSGGSSAPSAGDDSTASSGGATVTAATLARDQAQVDSARAALLRAKQDLAAADLVSPVAGTVAAVSVAVGDQVSGGSGPQVIVVGDGGDVSVTFTVPESKVRSVKTGQQAQVTPDGGTSSVPGTVTAIGLLSASTDGTAAYPVTVSVANAPAALASGASAYVSVEIGTAKDVVTVPTSALSTTGTGSTATVQVLGKDGAVEQTQVQLGARGALRSEVTSGLKTGQQVVLADLSEPLPSGDSNQPIGRLTGGGPPGGFTGGGFPGGGPANFGR